MRTRTALVSLIGFIGLFAAANAQTPPAANRTTAFDGTYRLVSSTKLNATYTTRGGQMGYCPDRRPGPLHVVHGKAHYRTASGRRMAAIVGPRGQLDMRLSAPDTNFLEVDVAGNIDNTGTARVRQRGNSCSYDFVWRK